MARLNGGTGCIAIGFEVPEVEGEDNRPLRQSLSGTAKLMAGQLLANQDERSPIIRISVFTFE